MKTLVSHLVALVVLVGCGAPVADPEPLVDAGLGAAADAGDVADAGQPQTLSNMGDCRGRRVVLVPQLPLQDGYWAATRLVPSRYPYTVDRVDYTLGIDPSCQMVPHRVSVFAGDAGAPPSSPVGSSPVLVSNVSSTVPGPDGGVRFAVISTPLQPLTVLQGQVVFVSVELLAAPNSTTKSLCLLACSDPAQKPLASFWSNATAAPFDWQDLGDTVAAVSVTGH